MSIERKFVGSVSEAGKLVMEPAVRRLWDDHVRGLSGCQVEWTLRKKRVGRTDRANRYYFGVVVPLIAEYCGYERDEMHEALAMKFLRIEDCPITGTPRRKHTPETNSKEFATYVDSCIRFAAELGVYVPQPGETW
jgi:hypothetical protein